MSSQGSSTRKVGGSESVGGDVVVEAIVWSDGRKAPTNQGMQAASRS